uniref:Cytochrome P450 n=1 Tax=Solanum tuberosum TaxID=4113 RepID=M1DMU2_SOLTU
MVDIQGYLILFLIWLFSTLFLKYVVFRKRNICHLPPSPFGLPIIGHLHLLSPIPHQALHRLSTRYGPLIHINLGSVPCLVVSSPEMAKEVLKTHETSFLNRPQTSVVDYLTYGSQDFSFAPYGVYWKFMKKLCMSELLGARTLDMLLPLRRDEIKRFIELLLQKAESSEEVDVEAELLRVSNNVISRMLMNERCSEDKDEAGSVRMLVQDIAELTGKFNLSDYIWFCKNLDLQGFGKRTKDVRKRFDEMMERIMNEHEEARRKRNGENKDGDESVVVKDLLDMLLDISEDECAEMRLTRENIKAFILDIFAAGTDTAAITVEWALAELINHPSIMQNAVQEIDFVIGKSRIVEESDILNLPYLQAIVKETLRLHPTGPMILRESTEDCCIGGYHIPKNTRLIVNTWAINRDPEYWKNPLEFIPERFLTEEEEGNTKSQLDVRGQHYHFLPFGTGRRGCPGTSLALQVVQISLASMIQCFEWKVSGGEVSKVDMEEAPGITLPRANPLVCVPVTRFNPFTSTSTTSSA